MNEIPIGYACEPVDPIGFIGQEPVHRAGAPVRLALEAPLVTVAPTGAGKGVSAIIPAALTTRANLVVVDPKGEVCQVTTTRRRDLGQRVVRIDPFGLLDDIEGGPGDSLNPLDLLASDLAIDDALTLAAAVCPTTSFADPFWDESAKRIIAGLLLWIGRYAPPAERHMGTLRRVVNGEPETLAGVIAAMLNVPDSDGLIAEAAGSLTSMPDRTRGSVLASMQQHVEPFASPAIVRAMRQSSISPDAIQAGEAIDIFLIMPMERLGSHRRALRLWLSMLLQLMARRRHVPARRTLMIVDETAALGPLDILRTAVAQLRGYGLTPWLILQDLSQLKALYPHDWQSLLNNAAAIQSFGARTRLAADAMAEVTGWSGDALALRPHEQIVALAGQSAQVLRRLDYRTDPMFRGLFRANRYFERPVCPDAPARADHEPEIAR